MRQEANADQLVESNRRTEEAMKQRGMGQTFRPITSSESLFSFAITRINGPVDEGLFRAPKDAK
jgi:hypothetical protein